MPRSSWNRTNRSFLNREISLFDEENLNLDENQVPYVMLTYGGLDYKLDFVQLSLPDEGVTKWLDRVSITNAPYLVKGYTSNQRKDFELTFTKRWRRFSKRRIYMVHQKFNPKQLSKARIARGLTMAELAKEIGVSRQSISKYEMGTSEPRGENLISLVNTLDFPLSYFSKESKERASGAAFSESSSVNK